MPPVRPRPAPAPASWRRGCAALLVGAAGTGLAGCNEFALRDARPTDPAPVQVTERFTQAPLPQVDILWVIDGTPSMDSARGALLEGLAGFLARLDDQSLSWQVGVTSTDLGGGTGAPGALLGDPWILTPATPGAQAVLDATIRGLAAGEPSGGLGAATAAIGPALGAGQNRGFRRDNAALHVIFVSDSDDESEGLLGADPVAAFLAVLADEEARTGRSARASAVVGDAGTGCSGPDGTALPGDRYLAVADATAGVVGSICDTALGPVVEAVGAVSVDWSARFPLQDVPEEGTVQVSVDGRLATAGWWIETTPDTGASAAEQAVLVFASAPPASAEILVRYQLGAAP